MMLSGQLLPQHGIARAISRTQLVPAHPKFDRGSLLLNLTTYAACKATDPKVAAPARELLALLGG